MANNTLIGALRAEATLESGKFVDGAKKIRSETKQTEAQLKTSFSAMGAAVKGFGGAVTAGLSVGLLGGLAKKALDFAAAIKTTAAQVGVTTRELQEFGYAASQVGIKQADADKALERLNVSMGKAAAGSKTAIKAFQAVGVSVDDIKTKSKTEIFGQIADQMIKQGGAARNAAAANAIFGESASKLTPLLDRGSKGINELAEAAHRLGIVLSDQQIQQADETAQKLEDVKRVLAAQISGVVADNAASIVTLADALAKLTSSIVNFLGSNPTAALAILGALAGSRFGLPGAAAGGFAGAVIGSGVASKNAVKPIGREDVAFFRHNVKVERERLLAKRAAGKGITVGEVEQLNRMTAKLRQAAGLGAPLPSFDVPQFLAGAAPKGRKPPRARKGPRDRSDDVAYQFEQELRRAHMDTLRAQQSLATSSDERARLALELLDLQRQEREAELNNRVRKAERDFAEGKIDAQTLEEVKVQAVALRAEYDKADALERQAIAADLAANRARDAAELVDSGYGLQLEQLSNEAALAETAAERRAIELRILELAKQQERARLEAVIADQQSSELARMQAQQRLGELDKIYAGRAAAVNQGTRGPLGDFMASLPATTAKWEEALQGVAVRGFGALEDAIMSAIDGTKSLGEAFRDMAQSILSNLIRIGIQRMIIAPLANSLFPGGAIPGFATGGGFTVRGFPGIDKNVMSINGMPVARVSDMERVNISNDNQRSAMPMLPDMHFHFGPGTSQADARRTGKQAAAAFKLEIARSAKQGF